MSGIPARAYEGAFALMRPVTVTRHAGADGATVFAHLYEFWDQRYVVFTDTRPPPESVGDTASFVSLAAWPEPLSRDQALSAFAQATEQLGPSLDVGGPAELERLLEVEPDCEAWLWREFASTDTVPDIDIRATAWNVWALLTTPLSDKFWELRDSEWGRIEDLIKAGVQASRMSSGFSGDDPLVWGFLLSRAASQCQDGLEEVFSRVVREGDSPARAAQVFLSLLPEQDALDLQDLLDQRWDAKRHSDTLMVPGYAWPLRISLRQLLEHALAGHGAQLAAWVRSEDGIRIWRQLCRD